MSISFGNTNVKEMYFGNKKVAKVYFGNKLVWPSDERDPVRYDATCIVSFTKNESSIENASWTVHVASSTGEDITYSFEKLTPWLYYINDVICRQWIRLDPKSPINTNTLKISNYNDAVPGEYHFDASMITSKAGGYPTHNKSSAYAAENIKIDYDLNLDDANGEIWLVVEPIADTEVTRIIAPMKSNGDGTTTISVVDKNGVGVYNGFIQRTPSIDVITHNGKSYNYIPLDIPDIGNASGKFVLKKGTRYYIRYIHNPWSIANKCFYRSGGTLGVIGYATKLPQVNDWYDTSNWIYVADKMTEGDVASMNQNEVAVYKGPYGHFNNNTVYVCNTKVNFVKTTNDLSEIFSETDSDKIYYYSGTSVGHVYQNDFFSCISPISSEAYIGDFRSASSGLPDYTTVKIGDIFLGKSYYNSHYSNLSGEQIYEVISISNNVVNLKAIDTDTVLKKKTDDVTNCFTRVTSANLSNVSVNTDRKYEFLMS